MSPRKTKEPVAPTPSEPEPSEARQAFLALEATLAASTERELQRVVIDVQRASAVAHSVVVRDQEPDRRAMFERLAQVDLYDMATLERVRQLALATWYTRRQQLGTQPLTSEATVAPEVIAEARLRRGRMLRVLEHWFHDDAAVMAEVAVIRSGSGHQDLANDLEALADVYQRAEIHEVIQHDRKHFEADEVEGARRLAAGIFASLGLGRETDAKRWRVLCLRAWRLLREEYEEHRVAGGFLFRKVEAVGESYPSLYTAARAVAVRGEGTATARELGDGEPSEEDDAGEGEA